MLMYVRFPLSLRNLLDFLFECGIGISRETVRMWWASFGPMFAGDIRSQRINRMCGFRHHLGDWQVSRRRNRRLQRNLMLAD